MCFALMALAGCGVNRNPLEVRVERCPAPVILSGAETLVRYDDERRGQEDIVYRLTLSDVDLACDQDEDVVSTLSFDIVAAPGAALASDRVIEVPYFVAVLRDNSVLVAKKSFTAEITVAPGQAPTVVRETVRQSFASIEETRRYDYELVIGLAVSLEEAVSYLAE